MAEFVEWFQLLIMAVLSTALIAVLISIVVWLAKHIGLFALTLRERNIQVERQRLDLSLVRPSPNGALPVARRLLDSGQLTPAILQLLHEDIQTRLLPQNVPQSLHYAPKYPNKIEQAPLPQIEEKPLPAVVSQDIWQLWVAGALPDSGFLMGHNLEDGQPVNADWEQLYSALVGGKSGSGKSTLIRSVLVQSALQGGRFVVLDRHYGAGEESLGATLQPLRPLMLCDVAANERQMVEALRWTGDIGRRRLSGQDADKTPLILVVDETTAMLQRSQIADELGRILGEIAEETRKVGVYALCIGQNFSGEIMPTTIRNSFASFISCRARRDVARVMSGNTKFGQAAEELKTGQAVWMDTNGMMVRLAVPNATQRHVELVARQCVSSGGSMDEIRLPQEGSQTSTLINAEVNGKSEIVTLDARAQRAIQLFESGKTQSEIIAEVWNVGTSGRNAQSAAHEFQNILREYMYHLRGNNGG